MKVIGIIGGGQLGMYLAIAAYEMGYDTAIYDPNFECSARGIATYFFQGEFDDEVKLEEFCQKCDLITYEFENINADIVLALSMKYPIIQKAHPLILSSNRFVEKQMAKDLNILQAENQAILNKEMLNSITLDYPYILKSTTLGYDGKGQVVVNSSADLREVDIDGITYLAEQKVDFDYEISVIGVQSTTGELRLYPPFYNIHHHGILNITSNHMEIPIEVVLQANNAVEKIMKHHNIYGLVCGEFFVKDNKAYFNEMACRPHNSGHITMDANFTSQYENHLRALLGMTLGSTDIKTPAFMINVLGQDVEQLKERIKDFEHNIKYYDYHKEPRFNRKVGHLIDYRIEDFNFFEKRWR